MTSPVFETLFYGDMADKNKYIRIADVAPIGFENLLRFAYTDSLNLGSVEDAMLTAYAAKKYLLPQLLRECLTYIEQNMSNSSACVVFEFAQVLNSQQLVLQAIQSIDRQTASIITKKSFISAQASTVEFLANRKYLSIRSEYTLFCALLQWSTAEYQRRRAKLMLVGDTGGATSTTSADEPEPINWLQVRSIMLEHNLLQASRFLAMTLEEFAKCVAKSSTCCLGQSNFLALAHQSPNEINQNNADSNEEQADCAKTSADLKQTSASSRCIITESSNSLLSQAEQRAIFMNLALPGSAQVPKTLSLVRDCRQSPPDLFTLSRFAMNSELQTNSKIITTMTSTRSIHGVYSKFQCLNENIFITAVTIPIRLDPSSYINKTPKFECHLKFTTRPASLGGSTSALPTSASNCLDSSTASASANLFAAMELNGATPGGAALLMDSLDESLHISISREKDCFVRFKRPILIRMGNINEILITFQNYALDEDVALRMPKTTVGNSSKSQVQGEICDQENIRWLFLKPTAPPTTATSHLNVELSELHYYYWEASNRVAINQFLVL